MYHNPGMRFAAPSFVNEPFKNEYDFPCSCNQSGIVIENGNDLASIGHSWPNVQNQQRHGRAILTCEEARDIFQYKPAPNSKDRNRAGMLAQKYGVSVKTVRDIWVGRTWYRATFHLDNSQPVEEERLLKRAGRPLGAKDRKPRAKKEIQRPLIFQFDQPTEGVQAAGAIPTEQRLLQYPPADPRATQGLDTSFAAYFDGKAENALAAFLDGASDQSAPLPSLSDGWLSCPSECYHAFDDTLGFISNSLP